MPKSFKRAVEYAGTSLVGHIEIGYRDLVRIFGEPHDSGDGYKTDAHWALRFDDGTIATIYNYKDGKNYCGEAGMPVEKITDWHVDGKGEGALESVRAVVKETLSTVPDAIVSYAPQVIADNSGEFCGNALRFATRTEAEASVQDLASRWMLVRETRVVKTDDAVNYVRIDGRDMPLGA